MKIKKIIIFDLDDTLYKEIYYLKSAYKEIACTLASNVGHSSDIIFSDLFKFYKNKQNAFELVLNKYASSLSVSDLLSIYRNHFPKICITKSKMNVLKYLKDNRIPMGLITDGRSVQQRNKLKALGIEEFFSEIIISEEFGSKKPNPENFKYFENIYGEASYFYVGDNVYKDFVAPNKLNWTTICLKDNGLNIHSQKVPLVNQEIYLAKYSISRFSQILNIIK